MLGRNRGEADSDRPEVRRLEEQEPDEQVVPDLDELEHRHREDRWQRERQHHPQEDLAVPEAVDQRRLDDVLRHAAEVRRHEERRERRAERRVDEDRAVVVVDEADAGEIHVLRHDHRLHRDHHRRDDEQEQHGREPVTQHSEGVSGGSAHGQDERDRANRDDRRAGELMSHRQRVEQLLPARQREPVAELELLERPERRGAHRPERVQHHHRDHGETEVGERPDEPPPPDGDAGQLACVDRAQISPRSAEVAAAPCSPRRRR